MLISVQVVTQVFPDEYHLHTLDQFLSATARLNPQVNTKAIVIGLMDRLSAYAAREAGTETSEEKSKSEEDATAKLMERLKIQKQEKEARERTAEQNNDGAEGEEPHNEARSESEPAPSNAEPPGSTDGASEVNGAASKHRSIPENVRLFEIFYEQVISLVKMQRLPIQDITALLVSLANLALSVKDKPD